MEKALTDEQLTAVMLRDLVDGLNTNKVFVEVYLQCEEGKLAGHAHSKDILIARDTMSCSKYDVKKIMERALVKAVSFADEKVGVNGWDYATVTTNCKQAESYSSLMFNNSLQCKR